MKYIEFKECILEVINSRIDDGEEVKVDKVTKNNNILLDSVTIIKPGYNVFPTTYLNYYYDAYLNGKTIEEIVEEIFFVSETYTGSKEYFNNILEEYDDIKDNIVCKLINKKLNKNLLKLVPYKPYLDLAIVAYCVMDKGDSGCCGIVITNEIVAGWNITEEEMLEYAIDNTPKFLGETLFPVTNLLDKDDPFYGMSDLPLFILTNEYHTNGAICILDDFVLEDLADELNSDLIIIPASVHEVLIAPKYMNPNTEDLDLLINQINRSDLQPQDILSDHSYTYLKSSKKIVMN